MYSVAFTPDGKGLVSGSLDKILKLWDISGLSVPDGGCSNAGRAAVMKNVEKDTPCVMDFIGHKVQPAPYVEQV